MVLALMPGVAFATAEKIGNSTVTWELSNDNKTLTIGGTGPMPDNDAPWLRCAPITSITSVVIGEGVTSIGDLAFYGASNLEWVTIKG